MKASNLLIALVLVIFASVASNAAGIKNKSISASEHENHISLSLVWSRKSPNLTAGITRGNHILYLDENEGVTALDMKSGKQLWHIDLSQEILAATNTGRKRSDVVNVMRPVVISDLLIVGVSRGLSGHLVALDAKTGNRKWTFDAMSASGSSGDVHGPILSPPALWHDRVIFRTGRGLTAVRILDGVQIWSVPMDAHGSVPFAVSAQPACNEHAIYFNADFGIAYAFDPRDGHDLWSVFTSGISVTGANNVHVVKITFEVCSPILINRYLIVADGVGDIYALEQQSGRMVWSVNKGNVLNLGIVNGNICAATINGLFLVNPDNGSILQSYAIAKGFQFFDCVLNYIIATNFSEGWEVLDIKTWAIIAHEDTVTVLSGLIASDGLIFVAGINRDGQKQAPKVSAYRITRS